MLIFLQYEEQDEKWKNLIATTLRSFDCECAYNPNVDFTKMPYKAANGHTLWIRCLGKVVPALLSSALSSQVDIFKEVTVISVGGGPSAGKTHLVEEISHLGSRFVALKESQEMFTANLNSDEKHQKYTPMDAFRVAQCALKRHHAGLLILPTERVVEFEAVASFTTAYFLNQTCNTTRRIIQVHEENNVPFQNDTVLPAFDVSAIYSVYIKPVIPIVEKNPWSVVGMFGSNIVSTDLQECGKNIAMKDAEIAYQGGVERNVLGGNTIKGSAFPVFIEVLPTKRPAYIERSKECVESLLMLRAMITEGLFENAMIIVVAGDQDIEALLALLKVFV